MIFANTTKQYIAIIGDIKKSKQSTDRNEVQKKLKFILEDINRKYSKDIVSKFMITLGDEFQGLLTQGEKVMSIISEVELRMYPIKVRYGIGIGDITTEINPDIPLGADGPAYYNARDAITALKNREKKSKAAIAEVMIATDEENIETVMLLNSILSLMTVIKSNWTDRQTEIIHDYLEHRDNQISVATRLGITQSSVQKGLSNANFYSYQEALNTVSSALAQIRRVEDV